MESRKAATSDRSPKSEGLMNVKQLAAEIRCSVRQVWRMVAARRVPIPLRIGRMRRWRTEDIRKWINMGCPAQ